MNRHNYNLRNSATYMQAPSLYSTALVTSSFIIILYHIYYLLCYYYYYCTAHGYFTTFFAPPAIVLFTFYRTCVLNVTYCLEFTFRRILQECSIVLVTHGNKES